MRPARTVASIRTLSGLNDVPPSKDDAFRGGTMGDVMCGKYAPQNAAVYGSDRQFEAKTPK